MRMQMAIRHSNPLVFVHLIKAAGTTLEMILKRQYGDSAAIEFGAPQEVVKKLNDYDGWPEEQKSEIAVFMGHIHFKDRDKLPHPSTWITILREPVDRIMSDYYYIRTHPEHEFHDHVLSQNLSLTEFLRSGIYRSLDNHQTKYLSGLVNSGYGIYSSKTVALAKENLQKHFLVVGLTERFDESVILMKRALGWKTPYYVREKVTKNRPGRDSLSAEELSVIREYARMDLGLYEFARARFEEQLAAQDSSFAQEVGAFKLLNRHCEPYLPYSALAERAKEAEYHLILDTTDRLVKSGDLHGASCIISQALRWYPESSDFQKIHDMLQSYPGKVSRKQEAALKDVQPALAKNAKPRSKHSVKRQIPDRPLIFLYIEKAAGTTLCQIIKRQFGAENVHDYLQGSMAFDQIPEGVKAIQGHVQFSFYEKFPSPATWITVLRDPIDRVISAYRYVLETPNHHFHQYAVTRNLKDFIEGGLYQWGENAQVKYLCGLTDVPFGKCTADLLEKAKGNLKTHFAVAGLSERFDEMLILLQSTFGWRTPYYVRENVSRKFIRKEDLSEDDLASIRKYHTYDQELYQYVTMMFDELVSRQDASFREEVQVFKLLNEHAAGYLSDLDDPSKFTHVEMRIIEGAVHALLRERQFDLAELILSRHVVKYPESPELHNLKAMTTYKMGRTDEAKRAFNEITKRWPDHPSAYNYIGGVLWDEGDIDNAMRHFLTALKIDPLHRSTVINCGRALVMFNRSDDASALYSLYIQKNPRDGEIIWLRDHLTAGLPEQPVSIP